MIHRKTGHSLAKYDSFTGSNLQAVENEIPIEKIQYWHDLYPRFDLIMSSLAFQTYSNKHSVFMLKSQLVTLQVP